MNASQRVVYLDLISNPPRAEDRLTGLGAAYWHGFNNPGVSVEHAGPIVGLPGSKARAAFKAGQTEASKRK